MSTALHDRQDRATDAQLGLAVGDALGVPLEFKSRDEHPPVTEVLGGGRLALPPGVWTDDFALALALAESLIASKGAVEAQDLASRFVAYWRRGEYHPLGRCIDIGNATANALAAFLSTGVPEGSDSDAASGNGSLMRLAPIALVAGSDAEHAATLARAQSCVTHASVACLDACDLMARMMVIGIETGDRDRALDAGTETRFAHQDVDALARGAWHGMRRDEVRSGGYVVDMLAASLWSVGTTGNFEDAVVTAINLASDADTTRAVTG